MYETFRKEKIVEAKIQRLRNALDMMDTIVTQTFYCNVLK